MRDRISNAQRELNDILGHLLQREGDIRGMVDEVLGVLKRGNKILLFGNGGSASQAQHLAAEFVNRFKRDRLALPALALTPDSSVVTSIANDSDFSLVFSRQIEALGKPGDLAWALTTSGRSPNIVQALRRAKERGLVTLLFSGGTGGDALSWADHALVVPSHNVPRVQEVHLLVGHLICEIVEEEFLGGA